MKPSILEQVMSSQKQSAISQFDPEEIASKLFNVLSDREHDIIVSRYGLSGKEKNTLEEIGKRYTVTRERIRQVENASLNKIKQEFNESLLKEVEYLIRNILEDHGELMSERKLVQTLVGEDELTDTTQALILFLLNQLLTDRITLTRESGDVYKNWSLSTAPWDTFHAVIGSAVDILDTHSEPLALESLIDRARGKVPLSGEEFEQIFVNYLDVTKKIEENKFNEWGLAHWSSIRPKRMNDKIYLILKKSGKPLHFVDIAKSINDAGFDTRVAYPATIHNELILDDKYVLVGRGIYALKEWGYKPGVVLDVIKDVMAENKKPMTKEEIIDSVLKNRMVKRSTVVLALMNKKNFAKDAEGKYILLSA